MKGESPLHEIAQTQYYPDMCNIFLRKGANPNLQDRKGETPLHKAAKVFLKYGTFERLLECGADPMMKNNDGKTPLGNMCDIICQHETKRTCFPGIIEKRNDDYYFNGKKVTDLEDAIKIGQLLDVLEERKAKAAKIDE